MTTRETRDDIRRRCAASAIVTLESDVARRMCDEADEADALLEKGARALVEFAETSAAEVDRLTRERDALRRHYDAAAPEHNLLALLDGYQDEILRLRSERCQACDTAADDVARAERERDEAIEDRKAARDDAARAAGLLAVRTLERDARPEITAEKAAGWVAAKLPCYFPTLEEKRAWEEVQDALRAHAGKVAR